MKKITLAWLAPALIAAACTPRPAPVVAVAPPPQITVAPTPLVQPSPEPALDPASLAMAQRNLKALGYNVGKSGDLADPFFQRAILAFEKDQGLAEDGLLTAPVLDRLKLARAALLKQPPADAGRSVTYIYGDGAGRRQPLGLAIAAPAGLVSSAPANFMMPLRPGSQASFQFGIRAANGGFKPATTITCHAGRAAPATVALGLLDVIPVDCRGDGASPPQWRSLYSSALGAVVRQDGSAGVRDLVALRPVTSDWPSAARTGLDWALTHALEAGGAPVPWSSTAVASHFAIKVSARITGQDAGLTGKYAALACRRFEMVQEGAGAPHYPGIACQSAPGAWSLPGSAAPFAAPAGGIASRALPPQSVR